MASTAEIYRFYLIQHNKSERSQSIIFRRWMRAEVLETQSSNTFVFALFFSASSGCSFEAAVPSTLPCSWERRSNRMLCVNVFKNNQKKNNKKKHFTQALLWWAMILDTILKSSPKIKPKKHLLICTYMRNLCYQDQRYKNFSCWLLKAFV